MVKNLINKLKSGVKRARRFTSALSLSALVLCNGYLSNNCKSPSDPGIPDPINPVAILNISPESGSAPLEVKIGLDGYPRKDIVKYTLIIDTDPIGLSNGINEPVGVGGAFRSPGERARINSGAGTESRRIEKSGARGRAGLETEQAGRPVNPNEYFETGAPETNDFGVIPYTPPTENIPPYKMVVLDGSGSSGGIKETLESSSPINIIRIYDINEKTRIFFAGQVTGSDGRTSTPISKNIIVSPQEKIYIAGRLRCNETGSDTPGMLKVYDSNRNPLIDDFILTNSKGKFNFNIKRTPELENIIIRAAHGRMPGNQEGWVRTIKIPATSNSNVKVVAVPYGEFEANPNEFRNFMYEVTGDGNPSRFDYENFNRGIVIIRENLNDSLDNKEPERRGKFSNKQIKYIKNIITPGVEKVEKAIGTGNYPIKVQKTSENYNPGAGVIYIIPSKAPGGNSNYGGWSYPYGIGNFIQGTDIYIKDSLIPDELGLRAAILHEIGHIPYEHTTNPNSRMCYGGPTSYTSLDLKGFYIIYEPSYQTSDLEHPVENLKYILGKNFDNWN